VTRKRRDPLTASAASHAPTRDSVLARLAHAVQRAQALFLFSVGAIGVHVVDDNFLQPEPGTSAAGHLVSGLVPLAAIAGAAVLFGRGVSGDDYTGLVSIPAGLLLLGIGATTLWSSRRRAAAGCGGTCAGF
jgi:hypothetical protein